MVLDPEGALAEIDDLAEKGISCDGRLFISQNAHLVMPYHKIFDVAGEESQGSSKIGTTGRGIGPCYRDKVERSYGVRVMDILDPDGLRARLEKTVAVKNELLTKIYGQEPLEVDGMVDTFIAFGERLEPFVADTSLLLNQAIDSGKQILFEGAQGALLDIDHGTYPFVTSSNTTAGGACTGTGIGPTRIDEVIGVTKAYTTRVGNGPFPTELEGAEGDHIRELGQEYGATTGRPRRCGWFDALIVRLSSRINGLTSLALTRLDILDTVEQLKLCVGYRCGDQVLEEFPGDPQVLARCEPIFEEVEGWCAPTTQARTYADLPLKAREYVERISALSRTAVSLISVGPERESTITID